MAMERRKHTKARRRAFEAALFLSSLVLLAAPQPVAAYPQYQQYAQKHSGRNVDCAMCHRNHDGPQGVRPGQIGSLTSLQKARYQQEQTALEPGTHVDSPILNDFGNRIIEALGRIKVIELSSHPEQLAPALGSASDLDGDGIPDAREYLDGTNPLDAQSGPPWRLFLINLSRQRFTIFMTFLVTIFGIYGLNNLFNGFSHLAEVAKRQREKESSEQENTIGR